MASLAAMAQPTQGGAAGPRGMGWQKSAAMIFGTPTLSFAIAGRNERGVFVLPTLCSEMENDQMRELLDSNGAIREALCGKGLVAAF